jgi:hypothetical protein
MYMTWYVRFEQVKAQRKSLSDGKLSCICIYHHDDAFVVHWVTEGLLDLRWWVYFLLYSNASWGISVVLFYINADNKNKQILMQAKANLIVSIAVIL